MLETSALIVEDDEHIRKQLLRAVGRKVRQVDQAEDGQIAIDLFRQRRHSLILLDLRLPKLDGLEVLRQVRAIDTSVQVVIVTGHGEKHDAVEAINLRAFGFFEKPMGIPEIENSLDSAYQEYLFRERQSGGPSPVASPLDAHLDTLYESLAELAEAIDDNPQDSSLRDSYDEQLGEVLKMQQAEADIARQRFKDAMPLQSDEVAGTLAQVRKELERG